MAGKNYVDPLLTQYARGYRPLMHVNEQILPPLKVNKDTGKVGVYSAGNLRIVSTIKAPEGETPTITSNVSIADAWALENHSLKAMASDEQAENQDRPFDERRDKTELLMDLLSTSREFGLGDFMNTSGNFTNTNTLSGTGQWGGTADDPLGNIDEAVNDVSSALGVADSMVSLVIPKDVFRLLTKLPEIRTQIGANDGNGFKPVLPAQLAVALNVRQVIVPQAYYNSADQGQADVLASIWGKHTWAVYIPAKPKLKEEVFGFTVRKRAGIEVNRWRDEDIEGWWVKAKDKYDQYIVNEKAVSMIVDAIA
jgi:hypothetical protein